MFATCTCERCGQNIEFDVSDFQKSREVGQTVFGQTIKCPHCGEEASLSMPCAQKSFAPPTTAVEPTKPRSETVIVLRLGFFSMLFLWIVGIGLVFNGCDIESKSQSVMHQTFGAIEFCTGFILMGMAMLIRVITRKA